jgi:MFS family permease
MRGTFVRSWRLAGMQNLMVKMIESPVIIQHILGSALGPPVTDALSDAFGLRTAMMVLPAFTFTAALLFLVGSFYYERDAARVERIGPKMEESR